MTNKNRLATEAAQRTAAEITARHRREVERHMPGVDVVLAGRAFPVTEMRTRCGLVVRATTSSSSSRGDEWYVGHVGNMGRSGRGSTLEIALAVLSLQEVKDA